MAGGHKPRSGSLAFYPRVRAKKHLATFKTFNKSEEVRPENFIGYKAGMISVFGKNAREKSVNFGQETMIPATVIECPPVKIVGLRLYGKTTSGLRVLGEATVEKPGKNLRKKIISFKKKGKRGKEEKTYSKVEDLQQLLEKAEKVVLLGEVQSALTGTGKTKSDFAEINLGGSVEGQFEYAKGKFGKELRINEVLEANEFADVKGVDKGKGFSGVVKRFGTKIQRPKAKHRRVIGSISPWHPATVMWTVPRAGQMGYQTRTEYNKRVLGLSNDFESINPKSGFSNYGVVKNDCIIISGSVPGAAKRPVSLRHKIRRADEGQAKYSDLKFSNGKGIVSLEAKREIPKEIKEEKAEKESKEGKK